MKRLLAYLFIGLGLAVNNFAFALDLSSNRFISGKCIESNCVNGQGTYKDYYGAIYVGEWKDGKPHGQGQAHNLKVEGSNPSPATNHTNVFLL